MTRSSLARICRTGGLIAVVVLCCHMDKPLGSANLPFLVKDIYAGPDGSVPGNFADVNGTLFFAARDSVSNTELWRSDGTDAGTQLVKEIVPGPGGAGPNALTNVNGTLLFSANDITNGSELWRSDGTVAGTVLVKDIRPGGASSGVAQLINNNGTLFFTANDGTNGQELWRSDGTEAGTTMVKDVNPGSASANPSNMAIVGGTLYFSANDGANGQELWRSDGTAAGTFLVKDINFGSSSSPTGMVNVNGTLFFSASDGTSGRELWRSDGTAAGTFLVKDINPAFASSSPANLISVNGTLFFTATDGTSGVELWRSDGSAAGTAMVRDISPGPGMSAPAFLTNANGTLYFSAVDPSNGRELWRSDGTAAQTVLVKDINPGTASSNPGFLTYINGALYLSASNGANGSEFWSSDGTVAGTTMVADIFDGPGSSSPTSLTSSGGRLFFAAADVLHSTELFALNVTMYQAITVTTPAPASAAYDSTFTVAATARGGLEVTITADPAGVCSIASGGTSTATVHMDSGTGTCTVHYNQPGNEIYNPASEVTSDTTASRIHPTVTFTGAPSTLAFGETFTVNSTTTASSSPVYSSSGACSNVNADFTMTSAAGVCTSTVTWAADSNYNGATLDQATTAKPATQAIGFDPLPDLTYGDPLFLLAASGGGSGNPVTFASTTPGVCTTTGANGMVVTIVAAGGCSITAAQADDDNYSAAADVTRAFTVARRSITVTAQPNTKVADGTPSAAAIPLITAGTLAPGDIGTFSETYDTAAVGTGKTLTPSASIANSSAVSVILNYAITFVVSNAGVITAPSTFEFSGFFAPISMPQPGVASVNSVRAGQNVPVKWRLLSSGVPVSDPASFAGLYSYPVDCGTGTALAAPAGESTIGSSLQRHEDGYWQYNWNTSITFSNTCRVMYVRFSDGTVSARATFRFKEIDSLEGLRPGRGGGAK